MLNIYSSADKVVAEASDISADEEGGVNPCQKCQYRGIGSL